MANKEIFCNTPWYEAHIYWDGALGICCQESRKLYGELSKDQYNIKNMSLKEWFNSEPVRRFRKDMLGNCHIDVCSRCTEEQEVSGSSRRIRSNQKSVIFKSHFNQSFQQSPGYDHFINSQKDGSTETLPIDLHIDLGNYCNLACKMCWSGASSRIATQMIKWGHEEDRKYLSNDWTKDPEVWNRFLNELLEIPKLKNIHFMGGETLLTKRFEELVDFMIANEKFDVSFSFVTNGTVWSQSLMDKLVKFQRVGIEVSIETLTEHNEYVRQGTNNNEVLANIESYQRLSDEHDNMSLTIRTAISALTVGYYHTLLDYCLRKKLLIKSLIVNEPKFLNVRVLPYNVRQRYRKQYVKENRIVNDYNESDENNYKMVISQQINQVINLLDQKGVDDQEDQLRQLTKHCQRWDQEYGYDALTLYPELAEGFRIYGYQS